MSLKPELNLGETVGRFPPDLVGSVLWSLVSDGHRNLLADAKRFHDKNQTLIFGAENLKNISRGPAFLVFNHPQTNVLVEGILTMIYAVSDSHEAGRCEVTLVVAGEIPYNLNGFIPGSVGFMNNLSKIYAPHILLVPNNRERPEYYYGRRQVVSTIGHLLKLGQVIGLAAEGNWGKRPNETLSDSGVRYGAGQIAIDTYDKYHGQVLPVGFAIDNNGKTYVNIGKPLIPNSTNNKEVALQIAGAIKKLLPQEMVVR